MTFSNPNLARALAGIIALSSVGLTGCLHQPDPCEDAASCAEPDIGGPRAQTSTVSYLVNGWNARSVSYDGGEFYQVDATHWAEINSAGNFDYTQDLRDEWSVYLIGSSGTREIQLDLWTNQVVKWEGSQASNLHPVIDSNKEFTVPDGPQVRVNGWRAKSVSFADGAYYQLGGTTWVRNSAGAGTVEFVEIGRDEWTVSVQRVGNGPIRILDLWGLTVKTPAGKVKKHIIHADEFRHDYPTLGLIFSDSNNVPGKTCISSVSELPGSFLCWNDDITDSDDAPLSLSLVSTGDPSFDPNQYNFVGGDHWLCYDRSIAEPGQVRRDLQAGCGAAGHRPCTVERHHTMNQCFNGLWDCQGYIDIYYVHTCHTGLTIHTQSGTCEGPVFDSSFFHNVERVKHRYPAPGADADEKLIRGSRPYTGGSAPNYTIDVANQLKASGVTQVISFNEYANPSGTANLAAKGIAFKLFRTDDFTAPKKEDLKAAHQLIVDNGSAGGSTYLHCGAGLGRTGTAVTAYQILEDEIQTCDDLNKAIKDNHVEYELVPTQADVLYALFYEQNPEVSSCPPLSPGG